MKTKIYFLTTDEEPVPETAVRFDDDEHVHAVAEAYPEQFPLDQGEKNIPADEDHEEPINEVAPQTDSPQIKTPEAVVADEPVAAEVPEAPVVALDPVVKAPKKNVRVELEEEEEDDAVAPFGGRRGSQAAPQPHHTFFPVNFGSTSGGAIAIANSYSTGKGGTATSHATAYGSPAKQKSKKRSDSE